MIQVEIYDMLEKADNELLNNAVIDDESKALIDVLGMEGQKAIMNEKSEVRPYSTLTEQQQFICVTLFPSYTNLTQYQNPVPYRVLKEAVSAKEHFKFLYVLHETPAMIIDPVLVGTNSEYYYWSNGQNKYKGLSLIARWGEALESWGDMYKKAVEVFRKNTIDSLSEIKTEIDRSISLLSNGIMPTNSNFLIESLNQFLPFRK